MHLVTVAGIQSSVSLDTGLNLAKTEKMIRQAARRGAQIICLQELFQTPYFPQYKNRRADQFVQTVPGATTLALSTLAEGLGVVIIVPLFEKARNGKRYNTAVVIDERGRLLQPYRKIHLPQDPKFYEQQYFAPGDLGYRVYKTKFASFAVLICYDQWFPEAARMATLAGADIIFYPTAIGTMAGHRSADGDWHDAWETVMRGHAIANGVHVVAVNRVGREGGLIFWGQSFACDSFGKVLRRASAGGDAVMVVKLDLEHNRRIREGWGFLRNRRPDTYRLGKAAAARI